MKRGNPKLVIIIPCKDEADNLRIVVDKLKKLKPYAIVVGIDPSTTDNTRLVAKSLGCQVVEVERSGYDPAVYKATEYARRRFGKALLLYTDAGNKYEYVQVPEMIKLVVKGADMVLGVRNDANKTMLWHQKLGTKLVLFLINTTQGQNARDISPFRLVNSRVFDTIDMSPKKFRWPTELLVKAYAHNMRVEQVDVTSLQRIGKSKVSGKFMNSLKAGIEMLSSLRFIRTKRRQDA
jgi:glycosyltransferase involved in cell wall biosynthesis